MLEKLKNITTLKIFFFTTNNYFGADNIKPAPFFRVISMKKLVLAIFMFGLSSVSVAEECKKNLLSSNDEHYIRGKISMVKEQHLDVEGEQKTDYYFWKIETDESLCLDGERVKTAYVLTSTYPWFPLSFHESTVGMTGSLTKLDDNPGAIDPVINAKIMFRFIPDKLDMISYAGNEYAMPKGCYVDRPRTAGKIYEFSGSWKENKFVIDTEICLISIETNDYFWTAGPYVKRYENVVYLNKKDTVKDRSSTKIKARITGRKWVTYLEAVVGE